MTTATPARAPGREPARKTQRTENRTQHGPIEGRFRPIKTAQIVMAWSLFNGGHITKRGLRCFFALHEMAERRRYTAKEHAGCADYNLEELKALVGGRGSKSASYALSADLKRLSELGLVQFSRRSITFAQSFDQITVEDTSCIYAMWAQMHPKTRGRAVPVPRRTLRALAAGFTTADTAYVLATMTRAIFFQVSKGSITTDGRTKDAWVSETFGLSLRAIRTARKHLGELGWLQERPTHQNLRNLYGTHVVVNVDWAPGQSNRDHDSHGTHSGHASDPRDSLDPVDNSAVGEGGSSAGSATPTARFVAGSATPRNRKALPTEDLNTRRLGAHAQGPSGVCTSKGGRKNITSTRVGEPNLRDIQPADLADTDRLLELRRQAIAKGMGFEGEIGERDFLALANRARTRGQRPCALFFDLISKKRTAFITMADEDEGRRRQKEHHYGVEIFRRETAPKPRFQQPSFTDDERIVLACQRKLPGRSPSELFRLARPRLDASWTLDRWETTHLQLVTKDARRWSQDEDCLAISAFGPTREMYA